MSVPDYYDVCQQANHMSAVWGDKIYTLGGYNIASINGSSPGTQVTNSYLRILDFTKSIDFTVDNITTLKWMPEEIPRIKWGSAWADGGKIYLFGGEYEIFTQVNANGTRLNTARPPLSGTVWGYDIASGAWTGIPDSSKSIQSIVRAQSVFDSDDKTQYFLAGALEEGTYYVNGSQYPATTPPIINLSNLVTFKTDTQVWTNKTNDISLGSIQQGQMVYFRSLGTKGALVVLGGWLDSVTPRPMDTINLYDIGTNTWYTQTATGDGGNFPASRREFCAVSISAVDGTSHNIYIYGGVDQDSGNTGDTALSDVWILTMPYFRWVNVGRAPNGKEALSCNLLSERYLVAYRGRNGGSADAFTACDQASTPEIYQGLHILDITSLNWTTQYIHPAGTPAYKVPEKLYKIIGGNANGSANTTTPKGGFVDDKLVAIFEAAITRTSSISPTSTSTNTPISESTSKSGTPVGAAVGGTIGGIVALVAIFGFLFWRRGRRRNQTHSKEESEGAIELGSTGVVPPSYEMPVEPVQPPVELDGAGTPRQKPAPRRSLRSRLG